MRKKKSKGKKKKPRAKRIKPKSYFKGLKKKARKNTGVLSWSQANSTGDYLWGKDIKVFLA